MVRALSLSVRSLLHACIGEQLCPIAAAAMALLENLTLRSSSQMSQPRLTGAASRMGIYEFMYVGRQHYLSRPARVLTHVFPW